MGGNMYHVSNTSSLNMNTSSSKFELPNCAQCSLYPHWNKMWGSENAQIRVLASFGFGLVPPREKPGTDPVKKPCSKSKTSSVGSEERSRGPEASEVKPASEQDQTFQHQPVPSSHAEPPSPSTAASALQLRSGHSTACSGTSFRLSTCLKPRHKLRSCLHTPRKQPI